MASEFLPTRDLHAADVSAKLRYCHTARHQMITLVETRNYPERQMLPLK